MTEPSYVITTRASYDAVAVDYADRFGDELAVKPFDRAMLAAFAELVLAGGGGLVGDLGCGPGRVTAHLHSLGLDAFGVDLSPGMIDVARTRHPHLRFDVGSISAQDIPDGALGAAMAWYSIIHTPPERLPVVFAEFHRVLAPAGLLQLAFQVGDEPLHLAEAFGHEVSLDFHRLSPDHVCDLLGQAGFIVSARLVREADRWEKVSQAFLLARKP